jgi:phosphoserine phosphatase
VNIPICVDLDGTLIKNDVTIEALKEFVSRKLFNIFKVLFWLLFGRAHLKKMLAISVDLSINKLDFNVKLLKFIADKKDKKHSVFLATACDELYANKIAEHLHIFDGVFASNGKINLRAKAKARTLVSAFGEGGFIYAGNSKDDVYVWNRSSQCILVNPSKAALNYMQGRDYLLFLE